MRTKLAVASALTVALVTGVAAGTGAGAAASTSSRHASAGNTVLEWNANAGEAAIAAGLAPLNNPLHESRAYAMMHIAVHDALNAIDRRYESYAYRGRAPRRASARAAVATAARDVLVPTLLAVPEPFDGQAGADSVEADYAAAIGAIGDGWRKQAGIDVGRAAAAAVLALRSDDGSDTPLFDAAYPQGDEPGQWRFTPGTDFAFAPGWGNVTPFALADAAQFLPGPPPPVEQPALHPRLPSGETARRRRRHHPQRAHRGPDRDRAVLAGELTAGLEPDRPHRLGQAAPRPVAERADVRPGQHGPGRRLHRLLHTKYHYNYWRPVTAIREAGTDGNPATS